MALTFREQSFFSRAPFRVKSIYLHTMSIHRTRHHGVLSLGFALLTSCVALLPVRRAAAAPAEHVWVTLEESGEVVAIDPETATVGERIAVGKRPRGIKVSPDGKLLYVALSGSPRAAPGADESKLPPADRAADGVGIVDVATRKLVKTLPSGQDPESFDVSRDGKTLYVSNEDAAKVTVIDLVKGKVKKAVDVGHEPEGVTLRPDGKVVYVTCESDNLVVAISTQTFKVLAQMPTGPRPRSIAFTPDGKTAFVTSENGAQVTVLDAVKHAPAGTIKIEAKAKTPLGPRPMGTAMAPDGKTLYVSLGRGEAIAVIDVDTRKVTRIVDGVGARPWGIGVGRGGQAIYTANGPSNDVSIVDAATDKVTARVKVGGQPWGVAVVPARAPTAGKPPAK
jgi:PQQ-dependent catabolism-associated beta-propeller protein